MSRLYLLWAWLFVALGLTASILGPSLPELRAAFNLPLAAAGLVFAMQSAGYFGGVLLAGRLADARGRKLVCGAGAGALALGMGVAAVAPTWPLLLAVLVVVGVGCAYIDVGLNAAIADAVPGAERRAAAMNLLHGAFPVGTLVAPAGLALALQLGWGWRAAFAAASAATAASLVGFGPRSAPWPRAARQQPRAGSSNKAGPSTLVHCDGSSDDVRDLVGIRQKPSHGVLGLRRLVREPYLRNLAVIQGLYSGVEIGIAGWLATYLVEQFGAAPAAGALATTFYWAGFLIGRPTTAYLAHRYGPQRVLPWICLAGAAAAAAGVASASGAWAVAAYTAAGLAISGIFPTVMALSLEGRTHDAGAATALIVGAAALGGIVWPWLVGVIAQEVGLRPAMATAAAPLLVMLPLIQTVRHAPPIARSVVVPPAVT